MILPFNKNTSDFMHKLNTHLRDAERRVRELHNTRALAMGLDKPEKHREAVEELEKLSWVFALRNYLDDWAFDRHYSVTLILDERMQCAEGEFKEIHVIKQMRNFDDNGQPANNEKIIRNEEQCRIVGGFINHGTWSEPSWQLHT